MTTIHKFTHTVAVKCKIKLVCIVNAETGVVTDWTETKGNAVEAAEVLAKANTGYLVVIKSKKECRRIEKFEKENNLY